MTRSLLSPLRSRRVIPSPLPPARDPRTLNVNLQPGTRQTVAAIGALWLSFAGATSGATARSGAFAVDGVLTPRSR
ncbi:hypothetical protein [Horticoccus sp. 23ND18S-11]|uniref:hypothetical protein n=1 Tax=Horticoccus sp. 23ND18S-11 TaxID=3391832 RepID=UPI0039C9BBBA